jgi:hypothetical protein
LLHVWEIIQFYNYVYWYASFSWQKKDYEVALVGAFRREKDKERALQALREENEAAMKLVYVKWSILVTCFVYHFCLNVSLKMKSKEKL